MAEQAQILVRGVGLQPAVAEEVLARTGAARETDGGLLWPLQVVAKLARSGALVRTEEGFAWANGAWPADFAIPAHMQAAIQEQWDSAPQYHAVLACAACGCDGREFRASVLADALGRTCLDLLLVLDEIERTTGMIHDVRDRDDVYAFHSSFLLEVIRGKLGIAGHGAAQGRRPPDRPRVPRPAGRRSGSCSEDFRRASSMKLPTISTRPARGMRRKESSIASRRPAPLPPVMISAARRITWRWPKSAPNCRRPARWSKWRNRSSVARKPR